MILAVSKTWPQVHFAPLFKNNDYSVIHDRVRIKNISLERGEMWLQHDTTHFGVKLAQSSQIGN